MSKRRGLAATLVVLAALPAAVAIASDSAKGDGTGDSPEVAPTAERVECPPLDPTIAAQAPAGLPNGGEIPADGVCIQVKGIDPTAPGPPTGAVQEALCDALPAEAARTRCGPDGTYALAAEAALGGGQ